MSLREGIFLNELKIASCSHLYKCDDSKMFNNYGPVHALPSEYKVFERIMYNRRIPYLKKYKFLFLFQFGFIKELHTIYIWFRWHCHWWVKMAWQLCKFDKSFPWFFKSFWYDGSCYYTWEIIRLLEYFVTVWELFEKYNIFTYTGALPDTKVLQDSILGQLLFSMYINDLANICILSFPIMFADGTYLFNHEKGIFFFAGNTLIRNWQIS